MALLPRRLGHAEEATLGEHLEELRARLFIMLGAIALGTVVAFVFHERVLDWLNRPLPPGHRRLLAIGIAEPFTVTLTVCVYAGFVLALPVVLWQLWLYFAPAFDPAAERKVLALAACAVALGAAGVAFGYWVLLPRAVHFLTNYDNRHFLHLPRRAPTTTSWPPCSWGSCSSSRRRWSCSASSRSASSARAPCAGNAASATSSRPRWRSRCPAPTR